MRRFVKLKLLFVILMLGAAAIAVVPSIAKIGKFEVPEWISEVATRKFKLGLDLQGGLHLEYSVDANEALENKLDRVASELETAFREKKDVQVEVERLGLDQLNIKFKDPKDVESATPEVLAIALDMFERVPDEGDMIESETGIVRLKMSSETVNADRSAIVSQAKDTVIRRVDSMGIAEPSIYTKNRQIVVELPGLSDTATELRAATDEVALKLGEILRAAGAPQVVRNPERGDPGAFRLTTPDRNLLELIYTSFPAAKEGGFIDDDRLGLQLQVSSDSASLGAEDPSTGVLKLSDSAREQVLEDSSNFRRLLKVIERSAVLEMHLVDDEAIEAEGKAYSGKPYLASLYEAGLVTQGMGISVNKLQDYGRPDKGGVMVKSPYVFYARERKTLEQFFANLPSEWRLPASHKVAYEPIQMIVRRGQAPETIWATHVIKSRAEITGDRIVNATVSYKAETGTPEASVSFDRIGADLFDKMSGENIGRKMAIMMDDQVVSDPIFNERIPSGNVVIALGSGDVQSIREQANDLVKVLKSGSLPARLTKEFEIRVGADLGKESVESGFRAFLVGLTFVAIFMMIYYRRSGFIAVFALLMNMILILAAMAMFEATLTLPGIAGMVLTIGMAVDANVIIFERVRDYLREGYSPRAAIDAGYERAFATILDSQLTTAIAGFVLWQYGSGPIKGFAITLLIGIATSIFTGVFTTRIFFDFQANRRGFDRVSI